ncbi:MAG TPA: non-canonical purine NTP pyrophosphatase [Candidatus Saccharimonadales bacterium]|nr:non-canonical purine NTP pyrophosphatase [Candidatus Saccharimonadales bacterium]
MQLIFVTGNREKFEIAEATCQPLGITLLHKNISTDEIQGEESEPIILHKAQAAYRLLKAPLVVSDDFWRIPSLQGFPGPYMKSVNSWFTPQNWLDLTQHLTDRQIILDQSLCYCDATIQKVFKVSHNGTLLPEARGHYGNPLQKVLSMPGDNGLSVAEAYDRGTVHAERDVAAGWRQLAAWLQDITATSR